MNAFETTYLTTPIAGAIGGGFMLRTHSTIANISGFTFGLILGVALLASFRWLIRVSPGQNRVVEPDRHQWIGAVTFLLFPLALPAMAFALSSAIVFVMLRL